MHICTIIKKIPSSFCLTNQEFFGIMCFELKTVKSSQELEVCRYEALA